MKQGKFEFAKIPLWAKISYALSGLLIILGMFNAKEIMQLELYMEEMNLRQEAYATEIEIINDKVDLFLRFNETYFNINNDDSYCLALNIYHEARGEDLDGMMAVGNVTMNRLMSERFPATLCGVVFQGMHRQNWKNESVPKRDQCHFSWYCDGKSDEPTDHRAWASAVMLAQMLLTSTDYVDITNGATHYHTTGVKPWWCKDMKPLGTIGNHVFYYEL
jgi:spore germination cell wall hydrolase CwlJ-like protein